MENKGKCGLLGGGGSQVQILSPRQKKSYEIVHSSFLLHDGLQMFYLLITDIII